MSADDQDTGKSLAARTAAAATAAAKQLGMVLGFSRSSPSPSQVPPSPPTSTAASAPSSTEGLGGVIEDSTLTEDGKMGKECDSKEDEVATAAKSGRSHPEEVSGEDGQMGEGKDKKAGKGKGNKANPFPQRPGEPDCGFFLKTGKCAYGQNCKFNHPPDRWKKTMTQRPGTPESDQYFTSPGGCKYGDACVYSHYIKKAVEELELNFLGLPIRPGEKECPLYMETGTCKNSTNCKYHHPNPTAFGGTDQASEFSGGSPSLLPDFGDASWVLESTSDGLHPHIGASQPFLQGMAAMHPALSPNNDWHIYQASIDPCFNHRSGRNLAYPAFEDATKCEANGKGHPCSTNDCKGKEDIPLVSTSGTRTEGNDGGNLPPAAAITGATKSGGSARHPPVSGANNNTAIKGSGKHPTGAAANNTLKGKETGNITTNPLFVPLEATKSKKKQKQPPSTNSYNVTKSSRTDKPVSIPNYVPKNQAKEQPLVSTCYEGIDGKARKNETFHYVSKGIGNENKPQIGMHYNDTGVEEYGKKPNKIKENESNPTENSGNENQPTKSKKNMKHSPVASAQYGSKGKAKAEQYPVSTDHEDSNGKGNESNPTKSIGESQPPKSKKNGKQYPVATVHYVPKGKAKEEQHPLSTYHDDSDGKGNESNPTKNGGDESQPSKSMPNEEHSSGASAHYITKGKEKEEQHSVSSSHDDFIDKGNESNPLKNSGNESQPTKSKKTEKQSPVESAHYAPKGNTKEQCPVPVDHGDSDSKGRGNQFPVDTPIVSVGTGKKGKHPPVSSFHESMISNVCGKDSPVESPSSNSVIIGKVSVKIPADVISSDVAKSTDGSEPKQPTLSTALPRKPECPYYLKKGGCKYKSCKFDHPKDLNQIQSTSKCLLSPKGLPLRPGLPICTYYSQNGICRYGPVCKYHHPMDVFSTETVTK